MVSDMEKMADIIKQKKCCITQYVTLPGGQHNETYWRNEFDDFYKWLMR